MKHKSLVRRYVAYLLIVMTSVAAVSLYSSAVIRRLTLEKAEEFLVESATMVKQALLREEPDDLDDFVKALGTDRVRITLIRRDGMVAGDSRAAVADLENHGTRDEIRDAYYGKTGVATRRSASIDLELLYLALPAFEYRGQTIVLRTSTGLESIALDLRINYRTIFLGGLVAIILISAIVLGFERKMIQPIAALQDAATEFAAGNLDHYLRVDRPEDLKTVAKSMNTMARSLKRRIEDVTRQRNEMETILESMAEGVVVFTRELVIYTANSAARTFSPKPKSKPAGKSVLAYFRNSRLSEIAEEILRERERTEETIEMAVGKVLQVYGDVLPDAEYGIIVLHDVTRLLKLEAVRKDFVANVSHELKTPVTAVKGYLETLAETYRDDPETTGNFLKKALRHTDRLTDIIEDLLQLSRIEEGGESLNRFEPTPLVALVKTAAGTCAAAAEKKFITIAIAEGPDVIAEANPVLLEHAVINLIDNAVKYSDEGETVSVTVLEKKKWLGIRVSDTGSGIPAKDLPRIFERFYRVDKARSRDLGGTGLGLAIVKHVAVVHGGKAEAKSVEGRGSTFTLWLPHPGI